MKVGKRFSLMTAHLVVAFALLLGLGITYYVEKKMLERTTTATFQHFRHLTRFLVTSEEFVKPKGGQEALAFDRMIKRYFFTPEVVVIKIYDTKGRLSYHSHNAALVGRRFNNNPGLAKALKGEVAIEISRLAAAEHSYERQAGYRRLLEAYIPVVFDKEQKIIGAYEVYSSVDSLYSSINQIRVFVWISILAGLAFLYLSLSWVYRRAEGTFREQNLALRQAYEELKQTQSQLILSEKLASAGRLAAGVVHEIGNPLAAILGLVELVSRGLDKPRYKQRCRENLERVASEIIRVKSILQGLLTYARPTARDIKELDLNQVIDKVLPLVPGLVAAKGIVVEKRLQPLPLVRADEGQIQQVLLNIIINAVQAMPGEGRLVISSEAGPWSLDDGDAFRVGRSFVPGEKVVTFAVADTGKGISPQEMEHIFEPFFTTRPAAQGAGLGLAVCHSLVQEMGGALTVESQPGQGSRFTVVLPLA